MVPFMSPEELKSVLREGVMCFPVTDFDGHGKFARKPFVERLDWLLTFRPNVVVATGGAGEFFSLTMPEAAEVVAAAVERGRGKVPVLAATGFGTRSAIAYAEEAERLGADGLLLLPPYLTESPQEGLIAHVDAICKATRLGIIIYNRANCILSAASVERLVADNPNLVAVKDGHGDIEELMRMQAAVGDRIALINGMPTAEVYARAYFGMGVPSYSSAIFNFMPRSAMAYYNAVVSGDRAAIDAFTRDFLVPYGHIRKRRAGYAVSIVKAGLEIIGRGAGEVRPPLAELTGDEKQALAALIAQAGPQE